MSTSTRANRGSELQNLILAVLESGPKHGYAIRQEITATFARPAGQGAIHGGLNALLAKGLVAALPAVEKKQPYAITDAGRVELAKALASVRKLAEVSPSETAQLPSYYSRVETPDAEVEQGLKRKKPKAYDPLLLPFTQLGGRRFEILSYLVKREEEGTESVVFLVKTSGDGGRDVIVHRDSKLAVVIQCKNLDSKLSLLALQEELLKLVLHDYREKFIPADGITYEIWAPGGFADAAESFISGTYPVNDDEWKEVFKRVTRTYRKLASLQWEEVQEHIRVSLSERIKIQPLDGHVLTQKTQSFPKLYSEFFDVLNVWKKDDVEQALAPKFNEISVQVQNLAAVTEGAAGDQIDEQINEARELINTAQFSDAGGLLRILERKKAHVFTQRQRFRVASNKGAIAYAQNRLEDAAQLFLQAVRLDPQDERGQENEVLAYYLLRDSTRAHALAAEKKKALPNSALIAALWINTAPPSTDPATLETEIPPDLLREHQVSIALARRYMGNHQIESADRFIESAKLSAPKWNQPWLVAAQAKIGSLLEENAGMRQISQELRSKVLQDGIDAATRAIELSATGANWEKAEALAVRSQLFLMRDELPAAQTDAKAAYLLDPESTSILVMLAQMQIATRELDQAMSTLAEAYKKDPRADVSLMYSKTLVQRGGDGDIERSHELVKDLDLKAVPGMMAFGIAAQVVATACRLANWHGAEAYLKAARSSLDETALSTLAAYVSHRKGEPESALNAAKAALESSGPGTHAQTLELLGQLLLEINEPALAIEPFEQIFEKRIVTFDPRQLLMCAYRLHLDQRVMEICDILRERGPVPWDIIEFELQFLEKYNFTKAVRIIQEHLRTHPENKLARLRLSVLGALHGLPELVQKKLEDFPNVEELPIEYLRPTLGVMRSAVTSQDAIDYAYRYLRLHFDQKDAHEAFIQIVISRADRETEPDLDSVVVGAAVYTEESYSGQGRWFVLEDTSTPTLAFEEISMQDAKAQALIGKRVGDTVVLASASVANREAVIKKILPKFVRRFQDCMSELQVRFGTSTMIQSVHVGGPDSIVEPAMVSMMTSVRQRAEHAEQLQKTYLEQPLMSLHVFGATLGLNTYELIYQLATKQDAWIRCHSGDPAEANAALLFLQECPDLLLDLTTVATLRLLGLEWILSTKAHRFSMTQGTWEELRKTLVDPAISSGRKATLNYHAGGYSMTEESASAAEARQTEDVAFLAGIRENIEVIPAEALASQTHEMRSTLTDYLGEYGAESAAVAAGTGRILWTDDSQSAAVAQSLLGARRVWTQIFLLSLVEAGVLTRDDYSSAVAKLIGMKYTGVAFDALCVLKAAKMAEFRPGYFPLAQMVETFSNSAAPAENLIKTFLQFFIMMQQEPLLFHKKSLTTSAFLDALWANPNTNRYVMTLRRMGSRLFGLNVVAEAEFVAAFEAWISTLSNRGMSGAS